jgi:hypothetical protein
MGIGYESLYHFANPDGSLAPELLSAKFYFESDERMLVVDEGEPDEDPFQNLVFDEQITVPNYDETHLTALQYTLGRGDCASTFTAAAPGLTTQVRFGFVDGVGRFSGWTGFYAVAFPESAQALEQSWISWPSELEATDTSEAPATGNEGLVDEVAPEEGVLPQPTPGGGASAKGCSLGASDATSSGGWWLVAIAPLVLVQRRCRR